MSEMLVKEIDGDSIDLTDEVGNLTGEKLSDLVVNSTSAHYVTGWD